MILFYYWYNVFCLENSQLRGGTAGLFVGMPRPDEINILNIVVPHVGCSG